MVKIVNAKSAKMWFWRKMLKDKNKKEELLVEILLKSKEKWWRFEIDLNIIYYAD